MKYTTLIIVSSLICAANSFDMKYSLQKHEWNAHIPDLIANDTIDNHDRLNYDRSSKLKVSLNATDLAGGVTIGSSYVLAASFEIRSLVPACLFSIERHGKQKLALCLQQQYFYGPLFDQDSQLTITIDSANIPDGQWWLSYPILLNTWTELIISVNETGVLLLSDCVSYEFIPYPPNNSKQIHLTDDMDLSVGYPLNSEGNFEASIKDLDLYSPVDDTTIMALCPNFHSSHFRGDNRVDGVMGEKGDKGDKGDTGSKCGDGECEIGVMGPPGLPGPPGIRGYPGKKGDRGEVGLSGLDGRPGAKGDSGCQCTEDVIFNLLKSMPAIRGRPGFDGRPGEDGPVGPPGMPGYPGPPGPPGPAAVTSPASTDKHEALKAISSEMKLLSDYIIEKTDQLKHLTELITKYNERLTNAEESIKTLENVMVSESNL